MRTTSCLGSVTQERITILLFFSSVSLLWVPSYFPTYLSSPFPPLNKNKMVDSHKFKNLKIPLLKNQVQKTFPLGGVFCSCSWLSWVDFLLVSLNPFTYIHWAQSCARLRVKLRRNHREMKQVLPWRAPFMERWDENI